MNYKKMVIIAGILSISYLSFTVIGAFTHEYAHAYVAESHGCTAEIKYLPSPQDNYFMATEQQCPENVESGVAEKQEMVEIVGYQVVPLYGILGLITALILLNIHTMNRFKYRENQ